MSVSEFISSTQLARLNHTGKAGLIHLAHFGMDCDSLRESLKTFSTTAPESCPSFNEVVVTRVQFSCFTFCLSLLLPIWWCPLVLTFLSCSHMSISVDAVIYSRCDMIHLWTGHEVSCVFFLEQSYPLTFANFSCSSSISPFMMISHHPLRGRGL